LSEEHEDSDKVGFHILDNFNVEAPYKFRYQEVIIWQQFNKCSRIPFGRYQVCANTSELLEFEKSVIDEHGEGICFRTPDSPYKQGRSTLKEQYLVKLSRYSRSECIIIGFIEARMNTNATKRNATGTMKRQTLSAGMLGKDTLGSFLVRDSLGREFRVSPGTMNASARQEVWDNQEDWFGKQITIKHKLCGEKIMPRSPSFVGKRIGNE